MSNYTRSRSRLYRDDPGPGGGAYQPRNGTGYIAVIIAAVIIVVLVIAVVFLLKSCSEGAATLPDQTQSDISTTTDAPTDAPTDSVDTTPPADSAQPDATATVSPDDTAQTDATESPAAGDTSQPDATATPAAGDTQQPDGTASSTPTATPDNGSSSDGEAAAITPAEIKGTPDVNEYLPLRQSASSTGTELAKIQKDEEFAILQVSTDKSWLKVKYNDKTGYVMAKYVKIGSDGSSHVCTVTSETVNVRSGAGKSKDIIGKLKSGDTVIVTDTITESNEKWYKVEIGDQTGYVFAQYCRLSS